MSSLNNKVQQLNPKEISDHEEQITLKIAEVNVILSMFIHHVGRNTGLNDALLTEYKNNFLKTLKK